MMTWIYARARLLLCLLGRATNPWADIFICDEAGGGVAPAAHTARAGGGGGHAVGNLVKMLDDLGQRLTPGITDGSVASTLFNHIKHRPS